MAKLTVAEIKKQIAALEVKAQRLAADELKTSVSKVRALMDSLGVTLDHLGSKVSKKVTAVKKAVAGKKASTKRAGAGVVRYRHPETGAVWTGFGRAPGWIASAKNRDEFLVTNATPPKTTKKVATSAKKASAASKKAGAPAEKAARPQGRAKARTAVTKKAAVSVKARAKKVAARAAAPRSKKVASRKEAVTGEASPAAATAKAG
jgi:DNA-binding protein H-NS